MRQDNTLQIYADALNQLEISKLVTGPGLYEINRMLRNGLV